MSESQLAERPQSVKDYLALPAYRDRFHEVMGKRANQFMAAITAVSQMPGLKDAEPRSVIAAAMVAATLDLPVNPTLGQAHIVAYSDNSGTKVAQFQIGYKGLIQLALRSGQYKRLNAGPVSSQAFRGFDIVGEPILDFTQNDPTQPPAGYFCAFETLNGFIKVIYWSKEQAEAHARRFSKAYAKGYSTPWKSDFDSMATKTVIKAALGKWGLLSVEMQKAVVHDQGAQADVDADVQYVDGETSEVQAEVPAADAPKRPSPPPKAPRGAAAAKAAAPEVVVEPEPAQAATEPEQPEPPKPVAPATQPPAPSAEAPKTTEPVQPRAFLKEGEKLTALVEVLAVTTALTKAGEGAVVATVKGDFNGEVTHIGGATVVAGKPDPVPNPIWTAGARLSVALNGVKLKSGKIQARVESVLPFGAAAATVED